MPNVSQVPTGMGRNGTKNGQIWSKIPKPPYLSSLKMVRFVHFSNFLIPSEKYYKLNSLVGSPLAYLKSKI